MPVILLVLKSQFLNVWFQASDFQTIQKTFLLYLKVVKTGVVKS